MYKGIVLAGGSGTRLMPATKAISKQLLPIHDKPMIYYSISVLLLAGIRDILIISTPEDIPNFKRLFGNGERLGLKIQYQKQPKPKGLAEAFILGEKFIDGQGVCLVLGDNIFYGNGFSGILKKAIVENDGATIFSYPVADPERFGVVTLDSKNQVYALEEKPDIPESNLAVTGLYIYSNQVVEYAKQLKPSKRGELEITDVNKKYLQNRNIKNIQLPRGFSWLDTGTPSSLLEASHFISAIEKSQGFKIACLEEIAYKNGWIGKIDIQNELSLIKNSPYGDYLYKLINN